MIEDSVYNKLKKDIGIKRFNHSIRVMNISAKLAKQYNCSVKKAKIAGLLHDCGKIQGEINLLKIANDFDIILDNVMKYNKELIHSVLGARLAQKEYNVYDRDIINAIRFHTTGRENMSILEKIVYIADIIEPGRDFEGIERIRQLAYEDINESILLAIDSTLKFIIDKNNLLHLDTIRARNYLLIQQNME